MQVEHHDLHHEFPEFTDAIQRLRSTDPHFSKLFDEYNSLTANVEDLEEQDIPVSDYSFEDLKKRRVKLKDELYAVLVAHRG